MGGGSVTDLDELHTILNSTTNQKDRHKRLNTEHAYYKHTHKVEAAANTELFRQTGITYEVKLQNFCIILGGENTDMNTIVSLPTAEELVKVLNV